MTRPYPSIRVQLILLTQERWEVHRDPQRPVMIIDLSSAVLS